MSSAEQLQARSEIKTVLTDSRAFQFRIIDAEPVNRVNQRGNDSFRKVRQQHYDPVPDFDVIRDSAEPDSPHGRVERPADQMIKGSNFAASCNTNQKIPESFHRRFLVR